MKRVTAADYKREPGGVFLRLADERPMKAIHYYEYRARPVLDVSSVAAVLREYYHADVIWTLYETPRPQLMFVSPRVHAALDSEAKKRE